MADRNFYKFSTPKPLFHARTWPSANVSIMFSMNVLPWLSIVRFDRLFSAEIDYALVFAIKHLSLAMRPTSSWKSSMCCLKRGLLRYSHSGQTWPDAVYSYRFPCRYTRNHSSFHHSRLSKHHNSRELISLAQLVGHVGSIPGIATILRLRLAHRW